MLFAGTLVTMDLRVKCRSDLARVAAEINKGAPCRPPVYGETTLRKPVRDLADVLGGWAKKRAVLFRSDPLMEVGGAPVVLLAHELVECPLLDSSALEHHQYVLLRKIIGDSALVLGGAC